jgi:hypothetical protein
VVGNPARIINYRAGEDIAEQGLASSKEINPQPGKVHEKIGVGECALWHLPAHDDMRGFLMVTEFGKDLPFQPKRCFFVYDVPSQNVRGEHAHHCCEQFMIAVHGELSVVVDDGFLRKEVQLDRPSIGLFMPAGIWGVQYKFSSDAVLAVFASHPYSSDDYVREYSEFLRIVEQKK